MPLWLDPKGRKDQGGEEIGYLRSISAKIFETRSVPAVRRSDSEDFCPLRSCSGRAADFFKAGLVSGSAAVGTRCIVRLHHPSGAYFAVRVSCRVWPMRLATATTGRAFPRTMIQLAVPVRGRESLPSTQKGCWAVGEQSGYWTALVTGNRPERCSPSSEGEGRDGGMNSGTSFGNLRMICPTTWDFPRKRLTSLVLPPSCSPPPRERRIDRPRAGDNEYAVFSR
jgi:hypothetical protein